MLNSKGKCVKGGWSHYVRWSDVLG